MPAASDSKTAKSSTSRGRERTQSARRTSNSRSSSQRSASARKSSNGARSKAANGVRSKASTGARSKASNRARSKASNGARAKANEARAKTSNGAQSQTNSQQDHAGREALTALLGATVGIAGGVLLGRTALSRERKVMGVPVPKKIDLAGVGQQIGEAGRQFGRLAGEVRGVREKAEQIGRVLS
jgi:hypothetical protein